MREELSSFSTKKQRERASFVSHAKIFKVNNYSIKKTLLTLHLRILRFLGTCLQVLLIDRPL